MSILLDGTTGITTPGLTNTGTETIVNLTTTGNTILGDATTDTLNVGAGGLVKDASGNVGIGTSSPAYRLDVLKNINGSNLINIDNQWGTSGANSGVLLTTADVAGSSTSTFSLQKYKNGAVSIANNETNSAAYLGFTVGSSERMRLDSSGNLGLGVTPSAWANNFRAIQIGNSDPGFLAGRVDGPPWVSLGVNAYFDGSVFRYVNSDYASMYTQYNGHYWYNATSGTAGNAITWTQAMTLDASGNLSVGATAPVSTEKAYIYQSGTGRVLIARSDNGSFADNCIQASVNRNTSNNTFNAFAYYNDAATAYRFKVADSGAIATAGGIALGTATAPTSGIGVQFPATQSASSDANTLDDYEEGTWTPSVGGNATYQSGAYGLYTKIGNIVTCQFQIPINVIGTGSGNTLSGFPFTSANISSVQSGSISYYSSLAINTIYVSFYIANNSTNAQFVTQASSGTTVNNAPNLFGNGAVIYGSITYRVA